MEWDSFGNITFNATDFNLGNNVTRNGNTFTFKAQNATISLDFDSDGLSTTDIQSISQTITGTNIRFVNGNTNANSLQNAQNAKIKLGTFQIRANNNGTTNITLNTFTFTRKKYVFDVTRIVFTLRTLRN